MEAHNPSLEKKNHNQALLEEIKTEYPKFKNFWEAVLGQSEANKTGLYLGNNPSPLYVARFFASKLSIIKEMSGAYVDNLDENPNTVMPAVIYKQCMSKLQNTMGEASDFYYGETEILDSEGKFKRI